MNEHQSYRFDAQHAFRLIILLGVVSLFADMTYESARSINGQYLEVLGQSAITVGWVAGIGELLGFSLRLVSGYVTDRLKSYWTITIFGYILNLISVPLLALAGFWQLAVALMITERIGKAIRVPARDAMISYASQQDTRGWAFGLHEAMDQAGATVGPLLVALVLYESSDAYRSAYLFLFIPAILAILVLFFARAQYPKPQSLEITLPDFKSGNFPKEFWYYTLALAFLAAGFVDFPLVAFHLKNLHLITDSTIPILYSLAMVTDAVSALITGRLFDRYGVKTLQYGLMITLFFVPMVFMGSTVWIIAGIALFGVGLGVQESIARAVIGGLIPRDRRATGYGVFNAAFGIFWFGGSVIMGYLYNYNISVLIGFSLGFQTLSVLSLLFFGNRINRVYFSKQHKTNTP